MYVCIQVSFLGKCKLTVIVKNIYKSFALALHYICNNIFVIVSSIKKNIEFCTIGGASYLLVAYVCLVCSSCPTPCQCPL